MISYSTRRWCACLIGGLTACVPGAGAAPGDIDSGFVPPHFDLRVFSTTPQPDGKVIVGGWFDAFVGGVFVRRNLLRLKADNMLDDTFFPQPSINGPVYSITLQADGKMIVGGEFTDVGGVLTRDHLARLKADGTLDESFTPPALNDRVYSTTPQTDGKVIVGGKFTDVGGASGPDKLMRLKADGTLDETFTPPALNGNVRSTCLQADGKVIVGGEFTDVGGGSGPDKLIRLKADGTLDESFTPPANLNNTVLSTTLQADGKVIIGGEFSDVGGVSGPDNLARLDMDGTLDGTFTPPATLTNTVYSTTLQANGKVIVGGAFDDILGLPTRDKLVRLDAEGTVDLTFAAPTLNNTVFSAALQADGKVIVGGFFIDAGGDSTRDRIVRLDNGPADSSLIAPSLSVVRWLFSGTSPEPFRVEFEVSTDGGTSYSPLGQASRIAGGWQLAGLALPPNSTIRSRAFIPSGIYGNSTGLIERTLAIARTTGVAPNAAAKSKLSRKIKKLKKKAKKVKRKGNTTKARKLKKKLKKLKKKLKSL